MPFSILANSFNKTTACFRDLDKLDKYSEIKQQRRRQQQKQQQRKMDGWMWVMW